MDESIRDITMRYLDAIYEAETDEDVEEVLCELFSEGYISGFKALLEERIDTDLKTLR